MEATLSATFSGILATGSTLFPVVLMLIQNYHGLVLPVIIDAINQYVANAKLRLWIAFFICMAITCALNYAEVIAMRNAQDAGFLLLKVSFIFTQAQLMYKTYWEKSNMRVSIFGRSINK